MTIQPSSMWRTLLNPTFTAVPLGAGAALDLTTLKVHTEQWIRPAHVKTVPTHIAGSRTSLLSRLERADCPESPWRGAPNPASFETTLQRDSASERYSLALLLNTVRPDGWKSLFTSSLYPSNGSVTTVPLDRGTIRVSLNRWEHSTDSWCILAFRLSDARAWEETASLLRQQTQLSSAGTYFRDKLSMLKLSALELESAAPLTLGSAVFTGPLSGLAAEALLDRFVPGITTLSPTISGQLDDIAQRIDTSLFRVRPSATGYHIKADAFEFDLSQTEDGERTAVAVSAVPLHLTRSASRWFSATQSAVELSAVLLATGIGDTIQSFKNYVLEDREVDVLGNGYACISRRIMEMLARRDDADAITLRRLNELFDQELPEILSRYERLPSLSPSTEIICRLLKQFFLPSETPDTFPLPPRRQYFQTCEQSEKFFVRCLQTGRYHLDEHFLHKYTYETSHGERTSLTRKPIQVGGVTFPTGTICAVTYPPPPHPQTPTVLPLRLSMFSFPLDLGREVFRYHFRIMGAELRGQDDRNVHEVYKLLS